MADFDESKLTVGGDLSTLFDKASAAALASYRHEIVVDFLDAPGVIRTITPEGWASGIVDLEQYGEQPRRKKGRVAFDRVESFITYLKAHKGEGTNIYARGGKFTAYLNDHAPEFAGWADHIATFELEMTDSWKAWVGANGNTMDQAAFAEFLEERIGDIASPDGAILHEIATNLRVNTSIDFQSKVRLANGQVQLHYVENVEGSAGPQGDILIPEELTLVVAPYEGTEKQEIVAKFRWRVAAGKARFTYVLGEELNRIERESLEEAAMRIEVSTELAVLYGSRG